MKKEIRDSSPIVLLTDYMETIELISNSNGKELRIISTNNEHIRPWDFEIPMNYLPTNRMSVSNTEIASASVLVSNFDIGESLKISSNINEEISFNITGRVIVDGEVNEDGYSLTVPTKAEEHISLHALVIDKTIVEVHVFDNNQLRMKPVVIELIPDILLAGTTNYYQSKLLADIVSVFGKRCRFNNALFQGKFDKLKELFARQEYVDEYSYREIQMGLNKVETFFDLLVKSEDMQYLQSVGEALDNLVLILLNSIKENPDKTKKAVKQLKKSSIF